MPGLDMSRSRTGVKGGPKMSQIWVDKPRPGHSDVESLDGLAGLGTTALSLVVALIVVAAAIVIHLALILLWHAFSMLDANVPNQTVAGIICGSAALGIGASFYQLRKRQRGIYALIEIAFAFVSAALVVSKLHSQGNSGAWLAFAGATYLVVRGFDNIKIAKGESAWPWSTSFAFDTTKREVVVGEERPAPAVERKDTELAHDPAVHRS